MGRLSNLAWTDIERIGIALFRRFPERNPRGVSLGEIRDLVHRLPRFRPEESQGDPRLLEAIRRAWHEEFEEGREEPVGND